MHTKVITRCNSGSCVYSSNWNTIFELLCNDHSATAAAARDMYTECRQVVSVEELQVYVAPCSSTTAARVSPAKTFPRCSRFEYVVGETVKQCQGASASTCQWIKVRYEDDTGRLQIGWVTSSCDGAAKVAQCPAAACLTGEHDRRLLAANMAVLNNRASCCLLSIANPWQSLNSEQVETQQRETAMHHDHAYLPWMCCFQVEPRPARMLID
jgi:hypothetical protein